MRSLSLNDPTARPGFGDPEPRDAESREAPSPASFQGARLGTAGVECTEGPSSALVPVLKRLAKTEGVNTTTLPEVIVVRADQPMPRTPVVHAPSVCVVAQGCKQTWFGERSVLYGPQHYLVVSNQLPLETKILRASPDAPLLGLVIAVDVFVVGQLLLEIQNHLPFSLPTGGAHPALFTSRMDDKLLESLLRLARCLESPLESRFLGPSLLREVFFRIFWGEQGQRLAALVMNDSGAVRVARVIRYLEQNYQQKLDVKSMARVVNVSESSLHHTFKEVTALSPLQYLKRLRLHRARLLLVHRGANAGEAGYEVGYESPSQFAREFKRLFGVTPSQVTPQTIHPR